MLAVSVWSVVRTPVEPATSPLVINDVTQLNPVSVSRVVTPTTTEEIIEAVTGHAGAISIGGSRHSMGGQTATTGALQLDMRRFNRILAFDSVAQTITVQSGTTWRQIQARIDSANLAVKIMQSYANFTVGGSLSVNAHGRYVGLGPLVSSVRSFRSSCSPTAGSSTPSRDAEGREIFGAAIGGYRGHRRHRRRDARSRGERARAAKRSHDEHRRVPPLLRRQHRWLEGRHLPQCGHLPGPVSLPYARSRTEDRRSRDGLRASRPLGKAYRHDAPRRSGSLSDLPGGKFLRQRIIDPLRHIGSPVVWRNHEASLD